MVAEVGCNHMGTLERALDFINTAAKTDGLSYLKFQKRDVKTLLNKNAFSKLHPSSQNSFGSTYAQHREALELSIEDHKQLKTTCEQQGLGYACSVWDIPSARQIISLQPDYLKIPSPKNNDWKLLDFVFKNFAGDVHISLGMLSRLEVEEFIRQTELRGELSRTVLYSCVSLYPTDIEDLSMLELKNLIEAHSHKLKAIGFSGHHLGLLPDYVAYGMGARWFERHFTLNKNWVGSDQGLSLDVNEMMELCSSLNQVSRAMSDKNASLIRREKALNERLFLK